MDIQKLNLNLLRALHALLTTRHVTIAGRKLNLSQSAMSIALKQLREILGDEILVRGIGRSMQLTPLAKSLITPVRETMKGIEDIFIGHKPFIPETDNRTFQVGMTDMISFLFMPRLIPILTKRAPNIKLNVTYPFALDCSEIFENTDMDLVIGLFENVPETLKVQTLIVDEPVCVARKGHPAFKKKEFSLDEFLKYPHIMMTHPSVPHGNYIDKALVGLGYDRQVNINVPHGLIPLTALGKTNYITLTVSIMVKALSKHYDLVQAPPPFSIGPYVAKQYWHQQDTNDPAHKWLRNLIKEIAEDICAENKK